MKDFTFEDNRTESSLRDLVQAFKCLEKLLDDKADKLTEKEMNALYDIGYLAFNNSYGEEIPSIGHLTRFGKQEVFEHHRTEILQKCEHFIKRADNL